MAVPVKRIAVFLQYITEEYIYGTY